MVHMPHESTGKAAKLARPFFGPFRVLNVTPTNVEVRLVDRPDEPSIFVALSRVRPCYDEIPDISWSGHTPKRKRRSNPKVLKQPVQTVTPYAGPMTRSRTKAMLEESDN